VYILSFKPSNSKYFGSHDAASLLMRDNQILSIIEEERLTRQKHAYKTFPHRSILKVLEINGLSIDDIDVITIPFEPDKWYFLEEKNRESIIAEATEIIEADLCKIFPAKQFPPIKYYNHHLCHAASAYYLSSFSECLVITADGSGEKETTAVYAAENGKLTRLQHFVWPNSLGILYSTLTGFLGFQPNSGEGQTMGLSSYGKFDESLQKKFTEKLMNFDEFGYKLQNSRLYIGDYEDRYVLLEEIFSMKRLEKRKRDAIEACYQNLAFQLQQTVEKIILNLITSNQKKFTTKKVCLAGGLAMNVSMNKRILDSGIVDDIFIQPLAGDNGCMIGAAILERLKCSGNCCFEPMRHLYYGTEYSNEYIEDYLKNKGVGFCYVEKPWKEAARLVAKGSIIGWFNGRMEAGARALGNRSIISNPCKHKYKDLVNDLKDRERWRPLALSILEEYQHDYIDGKIPLCANFMIIARPVREEKINRIPAAIHVDGTTRPQIVSKQNNLPFHSLIEEFFRLTGVPVVMNTSLNGRGEPIVEHPEQALNFFWESSLDAMFFQNFLVLK
jgi:carbamoyltransferase